MRNTIILVSIMIAGCSLESSFPVPPVDITVGPLYSYINNPILKVSESESDFDNQAVSSPSVVEINGKLIMYFTALNKEGTYSIGRAESTDGLIWIKNTSPVIAPDVDGFSEIIVKEPAALYDGEKVSLFFVSVTKDNKYRIMIASSSDTLNFMRSDVELIKVPQNDLQLVKLSEPSVAFNGDSLYMYYSAMDEDNRSFVFASKASPENPLSWTSVNISPVLSPNTQDVNAFDHYSVMSPTVLTVITANNRQLIRMYYCGSATETGAFHLGLVGSTDGINFERYIYNPILHYGRSPSAIVFNNNLYVYYNELPDNESKGISLATTIKLR